MAQWIPRYETLSRMEDSSLFLVRSRLKRFLDDYGPLTWPVDCFRLVDRIQRSGRIRLDVLVSSAFSQKFDAVAEYSPEIDRYLLIMKDAPPDWRSRSAWRRCNFTVAHELGHIFLGHLAIPDGCKPKSFIDREDAEADEFASRLLMPEELILSASFPSRSEMAAAFLVSEQACFHRLNNLRRLDRLSQPPAVCPECGNRKISPCASWCRMCGASLGRVIPEKIAVMMCLPLPPRCPVCGSEAGSPEDECADCGYPRNNPCLAEYDQPRHLNPPDARFCEICGADTLYAVLAKDPGITRDMPLHRLFNG